MLNSCRSRRKKRSSKKLLPGTNGRAQLLPESQKKTLCFPLCSARIVVCSTPAGVAEKNAADRSCDPSVVFRAQLLPESQKKTLEVMGR